MSFVSLSHACHKDAPQDHRVCAGCGKLGSSLRASPCPSTAQHPSRQWLAVKASRPFEQFQARLWLSPLCSLYSWSRSPAGQAGLFQSINSVPDRSRFPLLCPHIVCCSTPAHPAAYALTASAAIHFGVAGKDTSARVGTSSH